MCAPIGHRLPAHREGALVLIPTVHPVPHDACLRPPLELHRVLLAVCDTKKSTVMCVDVCVWMCVMCVDVCDVMCVDVCDVMCVGCV